MTSILWLYGKMFEKKGIITFEEFEQAKEMHYKELNKVSGDYWNEGASYMYDGKRQYNSFEQYFNENFKND